jgi:hypothetical protein
MESKEQVRELLGAGADPRIPDSTFGWTPITFSSNLWRCIDTLHMIMERGGYTEEPDDLNGLASWEANILFAFHSLPRRPGPAHLRHRGKDEGDSYPGNNCSNESRIRTPQGLS